MHRVGNVKLPKQFVKAIVPLHLQACVGGQVMMAESNCEGETAKRLWRAMEEKGLNKASYWNMLLMLLQQDDKENENKSGQDEVFIRVFKHPSVIVVLHLFIFLSMYSTARADTPEAYIHINDLFVLFCVFICKK